MHRASCIVHHASFIVHRASCIVHRASCIVHYYHRALCIMHPDSGSGHDPTDTQTERGGGQRQTPHERDRCAENHIRFACTQRKHRPVDGRHPDLQFFGVREKLRTRHTLHGGIPRDIAKPYAGNVERHAHKQPYARHDRFLHHPLLLHRPRFTAARHFERQRDRRWPRRPRETRHHGRRGRRHQRTICAGHRVVQHIRRVWPLHLRR